jgi:hypothetical protein
MPRSLKSRWKVAHSVVLSFAWGIVMPTALAAQETNAPGKLNVPAAAAELNEPLVVDGRVEAHQLQPRRGQVVRPKGNGRATVVITTGDWTIDADDVQFQSLEFVWETAPNTAPSADALPRALIQVRARRVSFENCTFQGDGRRVIAVRWIPIVVALDATPQLTLQHCVLRQVAAGVDTTARGMMTIDCVDTLHVGPGPLVQLKTLPTVGNTLALALDHTTVRGARGMLATRQDYGDDRLGRLAIHAVECVFAPAVNAALVQVSTKAEPPEWLKALSWTGQGSIVADELPLMAWLDKAGHVHTIAEDVVRVSGLVRSRVRFEGEDLASPAASRLREWLAPLRSDEPPGISAQHRANAPLILPASGVE